VRGSKTSSAHEITHGINSEARQARGARYTVELVRNSSAANEDADGNTGLSPYLPVKRVIRPPAWLKPEAIEAGPQINCFYLLDSRVIISEEPPIAKSSILPHIPITLRGPRCKLYIEGQRSWEDTPLYVWDEWSAYLNGAATAWDLKQKRAYTEDGRDILMGVLEFLVYGTALMMKTAEVSPESHRTLIGDFCVLLKTSLTLYYKAVSAFPFPGQDKYFEAWRTGKAGKTLREYYFTIGYTALDPDKNSGGGPRHVIT
jgi:hypothetical protein